MQNYFGALSGYVDDLKLLSFKGSEMQKDTENLVKWLKENKLPINIDKCSLMYFETKRPFNQEGIECSIDGTVLQSVKFVKDLGINVDANFSFKYHVENIRKKTYRLINLCFRIFSSRNTDLYIAFYKTYIVSQISYCSSIFCSTSIHNLDCIEKIQRYFTKRLYIRVFSRSCDVSYTERLQIFKLESLESYYCKVDIVNLFKIMYCNLFSPGIIIPHSPRRPNRLCVSRVHSTARRAFFIHRTVMLWNRYLSFADLSSLNHLKSYLANQTLSAHIKGSAFKAQ